VAIQLGGKTLALDSATILGFVASMALLTLVLQLTVVVEQCLKSAKCLDFCLTIC